ncbi:hypothetical protein GCM10009559_18740 [Pseudonocardia zijingensis]|jgi:hypothetical protein|uniref:Uncharacterized protein n=1 Tax=Pseudonocardia zijingensis TaxID=153376 RepID=A0ABP4A682_9PSEU
MWVKSGRVGTQCDRIRASILTVRNPPAVPRRTRVTTGGDRVWSRSVELPPQTRTSGTPVR